MSADPLSLDLKALFRDRDMFTSADAWRSAGFQMIRAGSHDLKLIVTSHKKARGYLFKKYSDLVPLDEQLARYKKRLEGAENLRTFIKQQNFRHLVVPQKWLYELPTRFTRRMPSYVVIVEELPIFDDRLSAHRKSEDRHRHVDTDVLRELCCVFFGFKDLDFTANNAPFTKNGQIAFIDTGYVDRYESVQQEKRKQTYMKYAEKYLSGRRLAFAKDLWKELSHKS
jgi:hypothetical protein